MTPRRNPGFPNFSVFQISFFLTARYKAVVFPKAGLRKLVLRKTKGL